MHDHKESPNPMPDRLVQLDQQIAYAKEHLTETEKGAGALTRLNNLYSIFKNQKELVDNIAANPQDTPLLVLSPSQHLGTEQNTLDSDYHSFQTEFRKFHLTERNGRAVALKVGAAGLFIEAVGVAAYAAGDYFTNGKALPNFNDFFSLSAAKSDPLTSGLGVFTSLLVVIAITAAAAGYWEYRADNHKLRDPTPDDVNEGSPLVVSPSSNNF